MLLLVVDDLRTDLAHMTDQEVVTPNLLKFARDAATVTLDHAHVQQGLCSPSRNSFLTGRRPDTTRVWNFKRSFRDNPNGENWLSLPQAFKKAGFMTSGMGKVFHPGHPKNNDYPASWSEEWEYFDPAVDKCNSSFALSGQQWCAADWPDAAFTDGKLATLAVERLAEYRQLQNGTAARPWFLAVGFQKPHKPNAIPLQYLQMQPATARVAITPNAYFSPDAPSVAYFHCTELENKTERWDLNVSVPDGLQREYRRAYHGGMSFVDKQAGLVLDALDANGFADSTAVAFWGDHGWNLGEHGMFCKMCNFETVARIPLMLRVPWLAPARRQPAAAAAAGPTRCSALVEAVDIFPTLLDVAGLSVPLHTHFEGDSFAPVLRSALQGGGGACAAFKNATFTQYPRCGSSPSAIDEDNACTHVDASDFAVMGYSIYSAEGWRYTRWMPWTGSIEAGASVEWDQAVGEELYDHRNETGLSYFTSELSNVADHPKHAQKRAELEAALKAGWEASRPASGVLVEQA